MQSFPVTESTLSAFHLGKLLQEKYELSPETSCKLFRTGMNHLYIITDKENKFVLRIYTHNWRTKHDVSEELRLLLHLKENHISVSYPIADKNGELIQEINAPEGTRFGVLFSFATGSKIAKFTPEASYNIGIVMAKIHSLTEKLELNRITYKSKTLHIDSLKRTKSFFTHSSEEMIFVEKLSNYLAKEYEKVNKNKVRNGVLHLDIWFDNLHFDEDNKVTIYDFDFCGNGWLCHDISYFLYQLYNTNQGENEYEPKAESFLKGYESVIKLTKEENDLLPKACLSVMLFYLSMQCERYDTWSNIFLNEDHLKRFIGSLKRWIAYNKIQIV